MTYNSGLKTFLRLSDWYKIKVVGNIYIKTYIAHKL